jgi:hypothetical protein
VSSIQKGKFRLICLGKERNNEKQRKRTTKNNKKEKEIEKLKKNIKK